MSNGKDYQKLENQLCFPLYAASRLVTKCYQPLLKEYDLTYPQYLVLLVLWENDSVPLSFISERLILQSNTLTPLVKRMEEIGLLTRERSFEDERSVIITLTEKGKELKKQAENVPFDLVKNFGMEMKDLEELHELLYRLIKNIDDNLK